MAEVIGDLNELLNVLGRTARQEALSQEAEAKRYAQHVLEQAKAQAQQVQATILEQAQKQAEEARRRILAQARLQAQRTRLQAREALLDRVWQEAEKRLQALTSQPDAYAEALRRLALLTGQILGGPTVTLAGDPQGHTLLTPERLAAWSREAGLTFQAAPAPADTWGGLVATDESGRRQVDATFPTRLALARETIREDVMALLEAS